MKTSKKSFLLLALLLGIVITEEGWSLPMDWEGKFIMDYTSVMHYRRTKEEGKGANINAGSQQIADAPGGYRNLVWQNYLFELNPSIIINDSATLFAEISNDYIGSSVVGDGATIDKHSDQTEARNSSMGAALYPHHTSGSNSLLNLSQLYLELYSDTATFVLGRQKEHFALGAIYNDGRNLFDRYATIRDGVTVKVKIGNFHITPYWGVMKSTPNNMTKANNTTMIGTSFVYDNIEKDIALGVLYGKKRSDYLQNAHQVQYEGDGPNSYHSLGRVDLKIIDLFFKKKLWGLDFQIEAPIISGTMGRVFQEDNDIRYKGNAIIGESRYEINDNWSVSLNAGSVSGQGPDRNSFQALYLNPNYQIANMMFRYNYNAVNDSNYSIFDSYVVNAEYVRLGVGYKVNSWDLELAWIKARAKQSAQIGSAYNHSTGKPFTSQYAQSNDYGHELDFNAQYHWNQNISLFGKSGYHFVGDYYNYTNTATPVKVHNAYMLMFGAGASF